MGDLQRGVVKWFNDAKGFGFIEHTSGRDVFVHYSVIQTDGFKTLKDGEEVNYELSEGDKGLHAARVVRVNAPAKDEAGIAPKLENGAVKSIVKTASDMIEVTSDQAPSSLDADSLSHSDPLSRPLSGTELEQ